VINPLWFGYLTGSELLFSIWGARHPRALFLNLVIGEHGSGSRASRELASFLRVWFSRSSAPHPGPLPGVPRRGRKTRGDCRLLTSHAQLLISVLSRFSPSPRPSPRVRGEGGRHAPPSSPLFPTYVARDLRATNGGCPERGRVFGQGRRVETGFSAEFGVGVSKKCWGFSTSWVKRLLKSVTIIDVRS
jgi:hypothetical protein